jgi:16S rRNA processing protein RimM
MADLVEVVVGVIRRAHGIRGELAVEMRTDEPERRFAVGTRLRCENSARVLTVEAARNASGRWLVQFAEVPDRSAAEALRNTPLVTDVPGDERPEEPEEFYDRQLVGLQVRDADDVAVGPVVAVLHLPAQDLLEIETAEGTRLVPFVSALVPEVDLDAGLLRLADVAGLLDE